MNVEPILAPLVSEGRLTLRYLVCMMGECVVNTAAVYVKILAEVLSGNTGALDVPTGIANTPRRIPLKLLVIKLRLGKPENKVRLILLVAVLLNAVADAYLKIFFLEVVENIVLIYL